MKVVAVGCFEPGSMLLEELGGRPAVVLVGTLEEIQGIAQHLYEEVQLAPAVPQSSEERKP